jgi:hypothetical protein
MSTFSDVTEKVAVSIIGVYLLNINLMLGHSVQKYLI